MYSFRFPVKNKENTIRRRTAMVGKFQIRTDLALEARESCEADHIKIRGVRVREEKDEEREVSTTTVVIETENAAKALGKPVGTYITIEAPNMSAPDEDYHREISQEIAGHLKEILGERRRSVLVVGLGNREVTPDALGPEVVGNLNITRHMIKEYGRMSGMSENARRSVLVVGLGNREVTPDALGPEVVGNLNITRHMIKEYGRMSGMSENARSVSALIPGVMAQTGMETLEIIKGVVEETKPEAVIAIDALAARSTRRLNRTIQITDTGINPGSGVGNHRNAINEETLGSMLWQPAARAG